VDQANVELMVRLTARASAAAFAAALILFAGGHPHDQRRLRLGSRLFAAFIVAHTIHFGTVACLAVATGGQNIRERDGWTVVLTVAVLFYTAALLVVRAWRNRALGRSSSRRLRVTADVAVAAIAVVFLNSFLARVERMPVYWLPAICLTGIVARYFFRTRVAPPGLRTGRAAGLLRLW
jgi:hypothetical protein